MFAKYIIRRTDQEDAPGRRHAFCDLFVLDLTHDPHARVAALAYAENAGADGYDLLAEELRVMVKKNYDRAERQRTP